MEGRENSGRRISKEKEVEDSGRQKEDKRSLVKVTLTLVFVLCMSDSRLWKGLQILKDQLGEICRFLYKRARKHLAVMR